MTARGGFVRAVMTAAFVVVLAACAGPPEAQTVSVLDDVFEAKEIVVKVGTEVTWVWEGVNEHDVVSAQFESELQTDGTFTHTFDEPGTYPYSCNIHARQGMQGFVVVEP